MAWTISITATSLADARAKVLASKHAISETHHLVNLTPVERAESWVKRGANDTFENLLASLPVGFGTVVLHATGDDLTIHTFSAEAK